MGTRGRKSSTELATVAPVTVAPRPEAPDELTYEEQAEWEAIVDRMPGGSFPRETWPLLASLCRHTVAARRLAQLIHQEENAPDEFRPDYYMRLLRALSGQTASIAALSGKLRLSPSARYGARKAAADAEKSVPGPKPWE